jgi:hypothetical protein
MAPPPSSSDTSRSSTSECRSLASSGAQAGNPLCRYSARRFSSSATVLRAFRQNLVLAVLRQTFPTKGQSSGMLRRVALVRTDVLEELSASFIRVTRICELGTLAVTSNRRTLPSSPIHVTLMMEAIRSSEMSVLTRATLRNIPEDAIPANQALL